MILALGYGGSFAIKPLFGSEGVIRNGLLQNMLIVSMITCSSLELVERDRRISRDDNRGMIDKKAPPILGQLKPDPDRRSEQDTRFEGPTRIVGIAGGNGKPENAPSH